MAKEEDRGNQRQIRRARKALAAMSATYFMGVFDDNYFKEAAMLIALGTGHATLQGYASMMITAPRVLLAAPAGWASDRFPKRTVVIASKLLELAAATCGAIGVILTNWFLIFAMLGVMGVQATLFGPALNGSIPELYPSSYVPRANALIKVVTTVAILAGVALAGVTLDTPGKVFGVSMGRMVVAAIIIFMAVGGAVTSFGVPHKAAAAPLSPYPWTGPLDTFRTLWEIRKDRLLFTVIGVNAYFWFMGALQLMLINMIGTSRKAGVVSEHHYLRSNTITGLLIAAQLIGIAIGGFPAGRLVRGKRWFRWLWPAMVAMGLSMVGALGVPYLASGARLPVVFVIILLTGITGGLLLVPTDSFIQVRAEPERRGTVLAASAFASYAGIIIASFIANFLNVHVPPTTGFALCGAATVAAGAGLLFLTKKLESEEAKAKGL